MNLIMPASFFAFQSALQIKAIVAVHFDETITDQCTLGCPSCFTLQIEDVVNTITYLFIPATYIFEGHEKILDYRTLE